MALLPPTKSDQKQQPQRRQGQNPTNREDQILLILKILAYLGAICVLPVLFIPVMAILEKALGGGDIGLEVGFGTLVVGSLVGWGLLGRHVSRHIGSRWVWPYLVVVGVYVAFLVAKFFNAYLG